MIDGAMSWLLKMELKDYLTLAGVVAGYLSFIRLLWGDIRDWRKKPHLVIEFDPAEDLREWGVRDKERKQKVATVHVRNKGSMTALRCVAVLTPISAARNANVGEKEFVLHWADTDYTTHSNIAQPVDIGLERRRLDVAFAILPVPNPSHGVRIIGKKEEPGAWVAIPMALSLPLETTQAYLPPGEYRFRMKVECQNGKGDSREFLITSPKTWTGLSMRPSN